MSKNLSLKKETVRVLSGDELELVDGGARKYSSILGPANGNPTFVPPWLVHPTRTSSVRKPPHPTVSSVRPPNTNPTFVSSVRPTIL